MILLVKLLTKQQVEWMNISIILVDIILVDVLVCVTSICVFFGSIIMGVSFSIYLVIYLV